METKFKQQNEKDDLIQ